MQKESNCLIEEVLDDSSFSHNRDFFHEKEIVLFGAGRLGEMSVNIMRSDNLAPVFFVDQAYAQKPTLCGIRVLPFEKLSDVDVEKCIVLISAFKYPFHHIERIIRRYTNARIYTVYDLFYFLNKAHFSNGWYSGAILPEDSANILSIYNNLSDDLSKKVYLSFLKWRISRKELTTVDKIIIVEDDKYFNSLTLPSMSRPGIFIDGGAFDLSFSLGVLQRKLPAKKILAFEPDSESYRSCDEVLKQDPARMKIIQMKKMALSDKPGAKRFCHGHGLASRLVHSDDESLDIVEACSLDSVFSGLLDDNIIALKLHIEGGELDALHGAMNMIDNHRPLLMVNCSHNRDGLWKIQSFCMTLRNYTFYMRSHAFYGEGLTFYAVPN